MVSFFGLVIAFSRCTHIYPNVHEGYAKSIERRVLGVSLHKTDIGNQFDFDSTYSTSEDQLNTQSFEFGDSLGDFYHVAMTGASTALTSLITGRSCPK